MLYRSALAGLSYFHGVRPPFDVTRTDGLIGLSPRWQQIIVQVLQILLARSGLSAVRSGLRLCMKSSAYSGKVWSVAPDLPYRDSGEVSQLPSLMSCSNVSASHASAIAV